MREALETFKRKTGYDIQSYLESFVLFCNSYYPLIVEYYTGRENVNLKDAFGRLDTLLKQSQEIEPLFSLKATGLPGIDSWELLDIFTECQTKLWTIDNSSKWLRSAIIGRYGTNIALHRVLKTRETFENVSSQLGSINPQDDWVDITLKNEIEEEAYDANTGGGMFKINIGASGNFNVPNIVDHLDSEKILGKDISKNLRFEKDDLAILEYDAAIGQAFDTIIHTLKGAIPEFPNYGLPNEVLGSSVNAVQYPSLFKHLVNMFQRDARWVSVNLLDLYRKEDAIFMKIQAKTVTNNFLVTNIQI